MQNPRAGQRCIRLRKTVRLMPVGMDRQDESLAAKETDP
jgi:hypothetical protein